MRKKNVTFLKNFPFVTKCLCEMITEYCDIIFFLDREGDG